MRHNYFYYFSSQMSTIVIGYAQLVCINFLMRKRMCRFKWANAQWRQLKDKESVAQTSPARRASARRGNLTLL